MKITLNIPTSVETIEAIKKIEAAVSSARKRIKEEAANKLRGGSLIHILFQDKSKFDRCIVVDQALINSMQIKLGIAQRNGGVCILFNPYDRYYEAGWFNPTTSYSKIEKGWKI